MKRFSPSARLTAWTTAAIVLLSGLSGVIAVSRAANPDANTLFRVTYKITGTVLDTSGKPAANIPVRLLQEQAPRRGPAARDPNKPASGDSVIGIPAPQELQKAASGNERVVQQKTSDAAGHFSFTDLVPGKYAVMAGIGKAAVRTDIEITSGDPAPVTCKLNAQ